MLTLTTRPQSPDRPESAEDSQPATSRAPVPVVLTGPRSHRYAALLTAAIILAALAALIFGPARGARDDLGQVRTDLHGTRVDIHKTLAVNRGVLARSTGNLRVAERSLTIQQQGLTVAQRSEQLAGTTSDNTTELVRQTGATLTTVRQALAALGGLQNLRGDADTITRSVTAGVGLARSALTLAQQTLDTGRAALDVARRTLATLQESRDIQRQQLEVARQTLEQTRELNRKLPIPPVFPTTAK